MGLEPESARRMIEPIIQSKLIWRLPHNAVVPQVHNSRGIPQGLSASVLLAEAFLGLLCWKISYIPGMEVIAYIDDVNCVATTRHSLERAIEIVMEYEAAFRLTVAAHKSKLWGTDWVGLSEIAGGTGFSVDRSFVILGATWHLGRMWTPTKPTNDF